MSTSEPAHRHLPALPARGTARVLAICLATSLIATGPSHALARKKFDFVVGVDGDFKAARSAATNAASSGRRFHIFFPDGNYDIGSLTGDSNQKTTFEVDKVSMIGQSADKTVIFNKSVNEGIGITATLYLHGADDFYMQDLTVMNKANYGQPSTYAGTGRHVAIQEQSNRMIYKNVKQLSTQDTYYTKGTRTYWEGGQIDGTTDFICGGGDVYFNGVALNELKAGSPITASASSTSWGYVFQGCTIDAVSAGYQLGRSWDGARVVFLNSIFKKLPSDAAWGDPMNSVPKVFAEYNSKTSSGGTVDLSKRRKSYTLDGTTVNLNPVLTQAQAATYTIANVLGGTDDWKPDELAKQVPAPAVQLSGTTVKWDDNANALCWVLFKNGKYLANVTTNSYDASALAKGDLVTVRAANEMGGLGGSSAVVSVGSPSAVQELSSTPLRHACDGTNRTLRIEGGKLGGLSVQVFSLDGSLELSRELEDASEARSLEIPLTGLRSGIHLLRYGIGKSDWTGPVHLF